MKKKTNLKKGIVAASVVAGLASGLVAGLALGVPGFAGAQANNAPVAIESNASTLAKAAAVTLSDAATTDAATASTIPGTVRANSTGDTGKGHDGDGHRRRGPKLEAAAKALGMTAEELKVELAAGKTIAQVAEAKGVAISKVTDALVAEFKAHLDEEVASGEHTQAEADAKLAEFTTRVTDMVNNVRPAGAPGMGKGEGHGPRGGKGGAPVEAAAKALGMTAEELKVELAAGKTIAQVAEAKGVAISKVTDALVAEFKAHLDEEVASGEHTQAEADAKLAEFTTRVTDMVNNVRPAGGPRGMGEGRGPRGGKGGAHVEAAAKALGMTAEELKVELMAGKTIAQVAEAEGVAISKVTDALVAEFKAHLDEEVASGEHTQAEADAKLAEFTTRVTDMVNNVRPAGGPRGMGEGRGPRGEGHGPRGMREGHGPRGGGRDGAMSSAPTLQGGVTTTPAVNA